MKFVNATMDCLKTGTTQVSCPNAYFGLAPGAIPTQIKILDTSGAVFYDATSPTSGFDLRGQPCSTFNATTGNDACPFRANISWAPADCSLASCPIPELVNVFVTFKYKPASSAQQRSVNITRMDTNILRNRAGSIAGYVVAGCGSANNLPAYFAPVAGLCSQGLGLGAVLALGAHLMHLVRPL